MDRSNSDIPFGVAVSSFCSSTHSDTSWSRQVSMNPTRSTRDLPILSMDQSNTPSIAPDRIASISASSPGLRS